MIAFLRKNRTVFILNSNSNNMCGSPLYFYFYSRYLSTSTIINHEISNILVHNHNFAPEFASRVASSLYRVKNLEDAGLTLSFLRESGFSDSQLEKLLKYSPKYVCYGLEQRVKPKIKFFEDMGFSSDDVAKIISTCPSILNLSLKNNIIPSVSLLKDLSGSIEAAARVIRKAPRVLPSNLENTMYRNVEFFKSFGIPMERIRIVLIKYPNVFLLKPEVVRRSAEKAEEMGINASSINFIYAVPTIASMSSRVRELKLQGFRSLGFSDGDIMFMFRKSPEVLTISMEKIKNITAILLDTRKYTLSSIVMCPKSLQSSIEKRYIPRLQRLGNLESENLIKDWPSLATVSRLSDDIFFKKFISTIKQS